jgi:peroxiredoxin Q/BCP
MLSDPDGAVGRAMGIVHRVGLGGWNLELIRRTTFLVDPRGVVAAAWGKVRIRGHAQEVLSVAKVARTLTP